MNATRNDGTVEAQEFVLKDAEGQVKARLGIDREGFPSLQLYGLQGEAGGPLAEIGFYAPDTVAGETEGHPVLSMFDDDRALRVSLSHYGLELTGPEPRSGEPGPRVVLCGPEAADARILYLSDDDSFARIRHAWPEPCPRERIAGALDKIRNAQAREEAAQAVEVIAGSARAGELS